MALKQTLTGIKTQLDNILSESNTVTGHNDSTINAAFETLRNGFGQGGIVDAYAVISVDYPEGSTCICTNGITTFTAGDINGKWLFFLPSGGEWIVSCTYESKSTESSPITVEKNGAYSVLLEYALYIIRDGILIDGETLSTYFITSSSAMKLTMRDGYIEFNSTSTAVVGLSTIKTYDVSRFTKVVVDGYVKASAAPMAIYLTPDAKYASLSAARSASYAYASTNKMTRSTFEITDLHIDEPCYIAVQHPAGNPVYSYIYNLWFE